MPDIHSRIKLEATGADQAAREVLKLKQAYEQVAMAAKNLSPGTIGADPFAMATTGNTGVMAGGQSPADVMARETRNRQYQEDVRNRENNNRGYNAGLRAPGAIGGTFSAIEAAAQGRGGEALGGAAGMAGKLVGGGMGTALLAFAALGIGVQKFAESSFGRLETVYGGGISQRLGAGFANTQNYITETGRRGIPMNMVLGVMQAASQSGAQFNARTDTQFGMAMEAAATLGIDPGILGGLLGTQQRAGVKLAGEYGLYGMGVAGFGRGNMGTFLSELTRTIESAMQAGITVTQEEANRSANMISAYAQIGGLTPTGAVALNQLATQRGRGAAGLTTPEDIIAFQAMRQLKPGASVTETLMEMERSPNQTNRAVFEYLQRATGGDEDLMRFRVRKYLGQGTSWEMVNRFITTMGAGDLTGDLGAGLEQAPWMGRTQDAAGNWISTSEERKVYAARQLEALKGVQDASLELTTAIGTLTATIMGKEIDLRAEGVRFGKVAAGVPFEDVAPGEVYIEKDPIRGLPTSIYQKPMGPIFDEPEVGVYQEQLQQRISGIRKQIRQAATEGIGILQWGERSREVSEARGLTEPILQQFMDRTITTEEQLARAIEQLVSMLSEAGVVFTDGGLELPTR